MERKSTAIFLVYIAKRRRYHQTITLRIPLHDNVKNNLVYLCMDRHGELNPVGWGEVNHRKKQIVFEQVPLNTLFFPACFDEDRLILIGEPFLIQADSTISGIPLPLTANTPEKVLDITIRNKKLYYTGTTNKVAEELFYISLPCDTSTTQTVRVLRKYPEKRKLKALQHKLKGAVLLGSNNERKDFDTLYTLDYTPHSYLQEIAIATPGKYRYYRFVTHDRGPINMAHMEFLGPKPNNHTYTTPTPLPVFSEKGEAEVNTKELFRINGVPLKTGSKPEVAFDSNYLTFAGSSSIGMDFGAPVEITHIRFVPRNANNGIVKQNSYALMYYDTKWKEFEIQYADKNFLEFRNVPKATLFWLRNLTEGKEEHPFFYLEGKQYFLHTDTLTSELLKTNR